MDQKCSQSPSFEVLSDWLDEVEADVLMGWVPAFSAEAEPELGAECLPGFAVSAKDSGADTGTGWLAVFAWATGAWLRPDFVFVSAVLTAGRGMWAP